MKPWLWILFAGLLAAISPAQKLRHGVAAADRVVVGKQVATQQWNEHIVLHELEVARTLKGEPTDRLIVVELTGISLHNRPVSGENRLYCLHDYGQAAVKAGLPDSPGSFFKMSGYPGSNPTLTQDLDSDPHLEYARIVLDAEAGANPVQTAFALVNVVVRGLPSVRGDAAAMLAERPALRGKLTPIHWGELLSRAAGETADIPFKIALAQLCAEQRLTGLVDALCLSMSEVEELAYTQAVGRIARFLYGEAAVDALRPHLARARNEERGRLLLALGATSTESALEALLHIRRLGKDPYVDAALREHGSPRAMEILKGKLPDKDSDTKLPSPEKRR